MSQWIAVVALLGFLVLTGRNLPRTRWPVVIAATLAAIVLVVWAERSGYWPAAWRVR